MNILAYPCLFSFTDQHCKMENTSFKQLENQMNYLMDMLKIPAEKRNFSELKDRIQSLIGEKDNLMTYYLSKNDSTLEKILNNPGLQHLAENIFNNLNFEHLEVCRRINKASKQILDCQMEKPMFMLKKFRRLSKENQNKWIKLIESTKDFEKKKDITVYLEWNLKKYVNGPLVDLPCYSRPAIQDNFRRRIMEICKQEWKPSDKDMEIIKILAPLIDNSNAHIHGNTPIYWAAYYGHIEVVKILVPLIENPDAPNSFGNTPSSVTYNAEIRRMLKLYTSRISTTNPSKK